MSAKFLVDANLPVALARQLSAMGFDCTHILDLSDLTLADPKIWALAAEQSRIIISRDADFATLSMAHPSGPQVVWIRLGNVRRRMLLDRFQRDFPAILALLDAGERLIEVR